MKITIVLCILLFCQCAFQKKNRSYTKQCECYRDEVEVVELSPFISDMLSEFEKSNASGIFISRSYYEAKHHEVVIYTFETSELKGQNFTENDTTSITINKETSSQIIESFNHSFEGKVFQFCQPIGTGSYLFKIYIRFLDGKVFSYTSPYNPPQFNSESCLNFTTPHVRNLIMKL